MMTASFWLIYSLKVVWNWGRWRIICMIRFWGTLQQNPLLPVAALVFFVFFLQLGKILITYGIQHILFSGFGRKQKIPRTSCLRDFVEVGGGLPSVIRWGGCLSIKSLGCCAALRSFLFSPLSTANWHRLKTKNPLHFVLRDFIEVGGGFEPP